MRNRELKIINGEIKKAADGSSNQYVLSFSSEDPDNRWRIPEILDHGPGAADLTRLNEMGVLLFNHNTDRVIGRIVSARIENNRGVAVVEFDDDNDSQIIAAKVASGTLKGVSIRARGTSIEEVQAGATSADGRFNGPCIIYRKWTALEISIVSIPADATVGVGRSDNYQNEEDLPKMENGNSTLNTEPAVTERGEQTPTQITEQTVVEPQRSAVATPEAVDSAAIIAAERQRTADITGVCREFGLDDMTASFIRDGKSVDEVNRQILERLRSERSPVDVGVTRDEGDKFRDAATGGLLLRGGVSLKKPAPGANEYRNLSLRDLLFRCARSEGIANPELEDFDNLINRQFFTPSAAFASIMDNAVNKAYEEGYNLRQPTFERWTVKGSLSDFKPTKSYRFGSAGELLLVPEGGEVKHDTLQDFLRPERQLATYARQMTLTREAIYNDDYGIVSKIPMQYGIASKRTRNRQVYAILTGNPIIFDGDTLFSTARNNLIDPGTAPSREALQDMIKRQMTMKDEEGNVIDVDPRFIIVPVGMGMYFDDILSNVNISVSGGTVTSGSNSLASRNLEIIEEAVLNATTGSEDSWFMVADPSIVPTIQVDYLNGKEVPTIRRMEKPGQFGFAWDVLHDWGIAVVDWRGAIKNEGSAV